MSLPHPDAPAADASATLLERLADKLGGRASEAVAAVYGKPVTVDGVTVIPVAKVSFGFGGGAGRAVEAGRTGDGGGGGGGAEARPSATSRCAVASPRTNRSGTPGATSSFP